MIAPQETLTTPPRELNFYGEKAESIKRGFAIVSLRNPRPDYAFERGEHILANCKDDNEKVPVVVISNDQRSLISFSVPTLALDGCFSAEEAVEMLKPYPGYELTSTGSPMKAITFVHEDAFEALTPDQQRKLTTEPFRDVIKDKDFRHLFFPTMAYWMAQRGGAITEWLSFLKFQNLVTPQEIEQMKSFTMEGANMFALLENVPKWLQRLAIEPGSEIFKPMILGICDDGLSTSGVEQLPT